MQPDGSDCQGGPPKATPSVTPHKPPSGLGKTVPGQVCTLLLYVWMSEFKAGNNTIFNIDFENVVSILGFVLCCFHIDHQY